MNPKQIDTIVDELESRLLSSEHVQSPPTLTDVRDFLEEQDLVKLTDGIRDLLLYKLRFINLSRQQLEKIRQQAQGSSTAIDVTQKKNKNNKDWRRKNLGQK